MRIVKCVICNKDFETKTPTGKYCSELCRKEGKKRTHKNWAEHTGYNKTVNERKKSKRKAMSLEEKEKTNKKRREKYHKEKSKEVIVHTCVECGKEFTGRKKKYCSTECSDEVRRRKNKERWRKANPGWNDGTNKVCEWCGKEYKAYPRGKSRSKFCSDSCRDTYNSRAKGYRPIEERNEERRKQKEETKKRKEAERKNWIEVNTIDKACTECGNNFKTTNDNVLTCSLECSKRRRNRVSWRKRDSRLNNDNIIDRDITIRVLYKRDNGICYICGGKCNPDDHTIVRGGFTSGPSYPSIDHIIPLSRGGKHSWDNVKLSHHRCNALKSNILPTDFFGDEIEIDVDEAYALARKVSPNKKEVKQYNKDGKLIAVYESTAEASRKIGVKAKGIQNCARGECATYKGYVWVY